MKKVLVFLFLLLCGVAQSAQIVNVEYIHQIINQKWDIDIPYNPALTNPRVAANMKYLLTSVDVANEMLNGEKTTDYGAGEYATMVAADTIATNTAVDTLIKEVEKYKLTMVVGPGSISNDMNDFAFGIGAAGTFYVDWGDGTTQVIDKPDATYVVYRHIYSARRQYLFRLNGLATQYGSDATFRTCSSSGHNSSGCSSVFWVHEIRGCLGCIFPTLADGAQPSFLSAFAWQLPLKGELPAGFFAGIHGPLRENMFSQMFQGTLLSGIGVPLFDDLSGGIANNAFVYMFGSCTNLTGPSAQMRLADGTLKYLYEVYPNATFGQVMGCYLQATGLDDYANIPNPWVNTWL